MKKGKRATSRDTAKLMQHAQRQAELREDIVQRSLSAEFTTTRLQKAIAELSKLNVVSENQKVRFARKYGLTGPYTLTPDGLIIPDRVA